MCLNSDTQPCRILNLPLQSINSILKIQINMAETLEVWCMKGSYLLQYCSSNNFGFCPTNSIEVERAFLTFTWDTLHKLYIYL